MVSALTNVEVRSSVLDFLSRLVFIFFLSSFIPTSVPAADLRYVNLSAINSTDRYEGPLRFAIEHEPWLRSWVPDEAWEAPFPKQHYRERIGELYDLIVAHPEEENQEYLLLRAMVSEFLYHLSGPDRYDVTVEHYMAIADLPNRDYRYLWMLGLFNAMAARPYESVHRFQFVADRVPEHQLHPHFWRDYGYASFLAGMTATSKVMYDRFFRYSQESPDDYSIYDVISDQLREPSPESSIGSDELFVAWERESGQGLLSYPLGLWIPSNPAWRLQTTGWNGRLSAVLFTPEPARVMLDGAMRDVSYTVAVFTYRSSPQVTAEWKGDFEEVIPTVFDGPPGAQAYEYRDGTTYQHMGGGHGLFVVVPSLLPDTPGVALDEPGRVPRRAGTSGTSYMPLRSSFGRLPVNLLHVVFLDASAAIFDIAEPVFLSFLNGLVVE